jgi:hypothetical protein
MRFDPLEARRNHPEYLGLIGYSLSELDDQFSSTSEVEEAACKPGAASGGHRNQRLISLCAPMPSALFSNREGRS